MKTPLHLWVIGVVSLLWNAGGAYDYLMVRTGNTAYLDQMTAQAGPEKAAEYLAYLADFPFWVSVCWGLGVWGAIAGSILLLLRSRYAQHALWLSVIGLVGNTLYGLVLSPTPMTQMMGTAAALFSLAIFVVALLLVFYARRMTARGVLR